MEFDKQIVLQQLDKILSSEPFVNSNQLQLFLKYIVSCAVDGNEDEITAYNIATQALGRNKNFSPDLDPIVRVQAAKIRNRLLLYYSNFDEHNYVQISLPKGAYIPKFKNADNPVSTYLSKFNNNDDTTLLPILLFKEFTGNDTQECQNIRLSFKCDLIASLSNFDLVNTFEINDVIADAINTRNLKTYSLNGTFELLDVGCSLSIYLHNETNGLCIWSSRYLFTNTDDFLRRKESVLTDISSSVAELYGAIIRDITSISSKNWEISHLDNNKILELIVITHCYAGQLDYKRFSETISMAQKAVVLAPKSDMALCGLGFTLIEGFRTAVDGLEQSAGYLKKAHRFAANLIERAPQSSLVNLLYSEVLYCLNQVEEAAKYGEFAIALNPENHLIKAQHGYRRALKGDWEKGIDLINKSTVPGHFIPNRFRLAEFVFLIMNEDFQSALEKSYFILLPKSYIFEVFLSVVHYHLGNLPQSQASVERALSLKPDLTLNEINDLNFRNSTAEYSETLHRLLKGVGFR